MTLLHPRLTVTVPVDTQDLIVKKEVCMCSVCMYIRKRDNTCKKCSMNHCLIYITHVTNYTCFIFHSEMYPSL